MSDADEPVDEAAAGGPDDPVDPVDEGAVPPNDTPTGPNRRVLIIGAAIVALLALVVGLIVLNGDDTVAPAGETTTTGKASTTSTTIPELPGGTFEIATAKSTVPLVKVTATEPADWAATPLAVVMDTPEMPPASQDTLPARDALPRVDYPIQGRYAVEGGWEFSNPGPYTDDQPFTMAVVERRGQWVKVQVPVRPNGTEGWVALTDVDISSTTYRIEVHVGEHMVRLYDDTSLVVESPAVMGAAGTPTPTGRFYLTDKVPQSNPAGAYGPIALATDGYSEVMDEFSTGVPVVALHGTNRPELVGQSVSNGCIRLPNDIITQLSDTVPLGTPVIIWP